MGLSTAFKSFSSVVAILGGVAILTQGAFAQTVDSGALIDDYCAKCHNLDDYSGGIDL